MNRLETKAAFSVDDTGVIAGTAWPFGTPDRVGDLITKGAFGSIAAPLPMLFGHNPDDVVGVWESVAEDDTGLQVKGRLLVDDIPRAAQVRAMVTKGAITGLSIGFQIKSAKPRTGGRTITGLDLFEISLVSIPAHPGARITVAKDASEAIAIAEAINRAAAHFRKT